MCCIQLGYSQTAKIQFIHNAPDVSIEEVDVYIDDNLVVDNLTFKTGSAFLDIPFNGDMTQIVITNPTDVNDVLLSSEYTLVDQENYYVVLNGIYNPEGYEDAEPFDVSIYEGARLEAEEVDQGVDLDVMVQHGALGFDNTLIVEGCQILAAPISFGNSVSFSEYSGYSPWVSNDDIYCVVRESYTIPQFFYFPYNFPLVTDDLGLEGQAIIMLLTGFRYPENNNDGEPLNAWYLPVEGGDFVLLSEEETANIQFIHNAPDTSVEEVDVYANGMLVADDLSFKTGTPFLNILLDQGVALITVRDSDTNDLLFNDFFGFVDEENYYLVIDGIFDTDAYEDVEPFEMHLYAGAQLEASNPDSGLDLDILVHNGAIGFDHTLDVQGTQVLAFPLEMGRLLSFSDYSDEVDGNPYSMWESQSDISIEIGDYGGNIGGNLLSAFSFDFNFPLFTEDLGLENEAILMLLSGFEDPVANNDGQPFDVFYLTPEGGEFRSATLGVDDVALQAISIYPNPAQNLITIQTSSPYAKGVLYDVLGRVVIDNIEVQREAVINVSAFESGIYFLKLTDQNNNASTVRRIIKQ
ncbi:Por secretion system C-terminal sorting domain-containing protein [Dokdonia pacifica]|uniref:Por secretion system C-terminal sorting domain-containing protein n=2 Tax=Dokdonia pacifica TaxID=1627892 RepID=A0A239CAS2_9FLAO|nr:Por secretion system C-terminal sorting domain-containing protein [Dokdonia pacifica]